MNILDELPSERPSKSSSAPPPMIFSAKVSKEPSTSFSPASLSSSSSSSSPSLSNPLAFFDWKFFIIIILLIIVILAYFGINLLNIAGDSIQSGVSLLGPSFSNFFGLLGDSTGSAVNKAAEITADVTKTGVDIAEGTVQNVGNLMIGEENVGTGPVKRTLNEPEPDTPEDTIQKSLSSSKTKWCLVGEYQNKRGCIDISESDKCLSGQVFPSEEMCLNPTIAQ